MLFDAPALGRERLRPLGPVLDELDGAVGRADRSLVGHTRRWTTLPVTRWAASLHKYAMTSATSSGCATPSHGCSHVIGHPAGVGDRRVHDVGGDAELG